MLVSHSHRCTAPPAVYPINLLQYHRLHLPSTAATILTARDTRPPWKTSRQKHASRKSLLLSKVRRCHGWSGQNLFILWSRTYLLIYSLMFFAASIFLKACGDCDDAGKIKRGRWIQWKKEKKEEKKTCALCGAINFPFLHSQHLRL